MPIRNPQSAIDISVRRFRFPAFPLSALVVFASALVASANNPYTGIVDRNVFSLKPKTIEEIKPAAPPTPPVKLTLTGITTILGNKRALLKGKLPPRPPEPEKDESYMLSEGQRQDGIEIVSIDESGGKVVVNNNGITETLDFINNGAKLMAAAPPPTTPGVIPPPPGMAGSSPPGTMSAGGNRQLPKGHANNLPPGLQPIEPETQTIMMEVERERTRDAVQRGEAPPLPPTVLTPEDSPDLPVPGDGGNPTLPF